MAAPTFEAAGAGAATTASSITCPYPASISAGDLLYLQVCFSCSNAADVHSVTTPNGWTVKHALEGPTTQHEQAILYKVAAGDETGNLSITVVTGGTNTVAIARMYRFAGVDNTTPHEGGAVTSGTDDSVEAPSVTTSGADRLAVCFVFQGDDTNAMTDFTGESNGDWTEAVAEHLETTGLDGGLQLQTAVLASATTLSGGAFTFATGAEAWVCRAFALIPVSSGNQEATPSPVSISLSVATPAVANVYTVAPDPVTVSLVVPSPAVSLTYNVTPDAIVVTLVLPTPAITAGAITATPDPVALVLSLPEPSVASGIFATPDPVVINLALPDITFSYSQVAAPDPVSVTLVIANPILTAGAISATPNPVTVVLTLPVPAFVGDPAAGGGGLTYVRQISFGIIPF